MQKQNSYRLFQSFALLLGTIVGAGIFSLPYVTARAGFAIGVLHLVVLGGVMTLLALMYGEIILRTHSEHQYPGYISLYLGKPGRVLATASLSFGLLGSLIAYLLAEGTFLRDLMGPAIGGSERMYIVIFFLVSWVAIIGGVKIRTTVQMIMLVLIIGAIIALGILGLPHVSVANLGKVQPAYFFLPFGAILFSLAGNSALVDVRRLLKGHEDKFNDVIIASQIGAAVLYLIFVTILVGMFGFSTTINPGLDLSRLFGSQILAWGSLFGLLVVATSYIPISTMVIESLETDYKLSRPIAWLITGMVPLAIALSGLTTFISTILFVGAIVGGLDGVLIILAYRAARRKGTRKPEYVLRIPGFAHYAIMIIFLVGVAFELYSVVSAAGQ